MDVGVRELKQRLSAYLERVERGEIVRITDRGVPKAIISPIRASGVLEHGIDEGWIRPAAHTGLGPTRRWNGRLAIRDVLAEDRQA